MIMKFKTKQKYILFTLLIALNVLIRLPSVPHEMGMDSFVQHIIANSVTEYGYAKWWVNALSIFGFYPYSTPSAVSFILSYINQASQLDMETSIWIFSVCIGLFGIFTSYVLAGKIKDDDFFKFVVAFAFSLSPGVLYFTTWNMSLRGPFVVVLALFVYQLLLMKTYRKRSLFLAITTFILLAAIHHLIYFTFVIIVGYIIALFINEHIDINKYNRGYYFIILFIILFSFPFFTRLFIEHSRYTQLQEIVFNNVRYTGILLILTVSGFLYTAYKENKSFEDIFLLTIYYLFTPLLWIRIYSFWFVLLFSCLFTGIAFLNIVQLYIMQVNKRRLVALSMMIILLSAIGMSGFYQHWRTKDNPGEWYMSDASYNGAIWIKENINETSRLVGNDFNGDVKMFAMSQTPTFIDSDIPMFIYGFVGIEEDAIIKNSPFSISFYLDNPYDLRSDYTRVGNIRNRLQTINIESSAAQTIISNYNLSYFMENQEALPNLLTLSVQNSESKIYENGKIRVWTISHS